LSTNQTTSLTVKLAVAVSVLPDASVTVYVKESGPS
jgi:hypothetical protein